MLRLMISFWFALIFSSSSSAQNSKTVIVALGDSLTEGYGIAREMAYPALVEKKLIADGYNVQVINSGSSGSTTASAKNRVQWILKQKPNIIFLALGANDGLRGLDLKMAKQNLLEAIRLAKKNNIQVWLAGMKMPPNYGLKYTEEFAQIFPAVAKAESIPLLPFLLEGVAGQPELNLTDKIHPNEKGHALLAQHVTAFFKKQLKK